MGFITALVLMVVALEITSRLYPCRPPPANFQPAVCDPQIFPPNQEAVEAVLILREQRQTPAIISAEVYREALDEIIFEVAPEKLNGFNGVACNGVGYVRVDLPAQAKLFVKRHELEHLLQTGAQSNREFAANLVAAQEYPFGLMATVVFTLKNVGQADASLGCIIGALWQSFKLYFLPF